jgi:hypothetical protein
LVAIGRRIFKNVPDEMDRFFSVVHENRSQRMRFGGSIGYIPSLKGTGELRERLVTT